MPEQVAQRMTGGLQFAGEKILVVFWLSLRTLCSSQTIWNDKNSEAGFTKCEIASAFMGHQNNQTS